ncbi:MAG: diguanylate cyclase [Candidatus Thiodiazotropha sp.]|jgi:two-component system, cell cycle response regulator
MADRIMLVDSSTATREVLTRRLKKAIPGIRITTCTSAVEALKQMEQERYSLITTALLLPDMDGLDLCRSIRSSKRHRYTPVIVVSSDADQRLLHEGFNAGVTDYFDKALGFKVFGEYIKSFLERNPSLRGRILYIEDSKTAARMTKQMLEEHGMEVVHVTSVEEAQILLENARKQQLQEFDLVITDFHLKGEMTGGDLLYFLRVSLHYSQQELPVLVTTGNEIVNTQVEVFHAGANDFVIKPLVEEIVMARVRSLLLVKFQYDTLHEQTADMERLATTDALTGTRNRRYLVDEGQGFLTRAAKGWVMIIDLDNFKRINDTQGHLVGDQVLIAIGKLLKQRFKAALAARFGGEEFVVISHGAKIPARVEMLRSAIENLNPVGIKVTVSIGLVCVEDYPGKDLNTLLSYADQALYKAKDSGRNQVCIYEPKKFS